MTKKTFRCACVDGCTVVYQSSFCDQNKFLLQEANTHPDNSELGLNEYYYKKDILDEFMKNKIIIIITLRIGERVLHSVVYRKSTVTLGHN